METKKTSTHKTRDHEEVKTRGREEDKHSLTRTRHNHVETEKQVDTKKCTRTRSKHVNTTWTNTYVNTQKRQLREHDEDKTREHDEDKTRENAQDTTT